MACDDDDTTPRAPAAGKIQRQSLIDALKAARRMQRHLSPEQWETLKKISADSAAAVRAVQKAIPPDTAVVMVRAVQKTLPPETWKEIGREVAADDDPPASTPTSGPAAATSENPLASTSAAMLALAPVPTGLGPQATRVARVLIREVFPPDGKKLRGFSDKAVRHQAIVALAAERKRDQAPADEKHLGDPGMRAVKAAIDRLGRKN